MKKQPAYRCLFNHELLSLFTVQTPYQSYREPVGDAQVIGCVREWAGTQIDALMCCPQSWMTPAWFSEIDRKWQDEAPHEQEPLPGCDWKYYEKAYYRMRRYMLRDPRPDPVGLTLQTARDIGMGAFLSYRMNEAHHLQDESCPTHSSFWRKHREYRIQPKDARNTDRHVPAPLNYLVPEVRDWVFDHLSELVERYDVDGLELDFQRSPWLFPSERIEKGREILTTFVAQVRELLARVAERRGKQILLGVRIPHTLERCARQGMDPETWDRMNLVDMINVSSYFRTTLESDIAGFKRAAPNSRIFGEIHFVTQGGQLASGYRNNVNRRTTRPIYETCALSYLDRGADGLSFFNIGYLRDHSFAEPRLQEYPGQEPPFDLFKHICDTDYLRMRPKQYAITPGFDLLPRTPQGPDASLALPLHVADTMGQGHPFTHAALRIETAQPCQALALQASLNGVELESYAGEGELFEPFSKMALPLPDCLVHYRVPMDSVKQGLNTIRIVNPRAQGRGTKAPVSIERVELALYT